MVVLKRLGRNAEAKQLVDQNSSDTTKPVENLKTSCMFQSCNQVSRQKEKQDSQPKEEDKKFSQEKSQTGHKIGARKKSWMNEKSLITSCKGKENLLPVSASDERQGGTVHFCAKNKVFAAKEVGQPETTPMKD